MEKAPLAAGVKLKEVSTRETVYQGCTVVQADAVGLVFEVERTLAEGGNIETVVSQLLVPWASINYVVLSERRR